MQDRVRVTAAEAGIDRQGYLHLFLHDDHVNKRITVKLDREILTAIARERA